MRKLTVVGINWLLIGVIAVPLKIFLDYLTAPSTGYMYTLGIDENTIALLGLYPWLLPICWFIGTIWYLILPEAPEKQQPTDSFGNQPRSIIYKPPKASKPPKITNLNKNKGTWF